MENYLETMIDLIKSHKCLWDTRHPHYKLKKKKTEYFLEVTSKLKILFPQYDFDSQYVQGKWKNLKTYFMRLYQNTIKKSSGMSTDELFISNWPHFKSMMFLKDVIEAGPSKNNLEIYSEPEQQSTNSLNETQILEEYTDLEESQSLLGMNRNKILLETLDSDLTLEENIEIENQFSVYNETETLQKPKSLNPENTGLKRKIKSVNKDITSKKLKTGEDISRNDAYEAVTNAMKSLTQAEENDEEVYGKHIGRQMSALPKIHRERLRLKIQELFLNAYEEVNANNNP